MLIRNLYSMIRFALVRRFDAEPPLTQAEIDARQSRYPKPKLRGRFVRLSLDSARWERGKLWRAE
ncbi:MAG: hypothetical protein M3348_11035 [Acidobacteriota bacterium]|nr:hypothetical protein [Acidobacteriota bacterium]